jgi:hypothetical protein
LFFYEVFKGDQVEICFESGYFETVDQKIYLGLVNVYQLVAFKRKYKYLLPLCLYVLFSAPLVLILRCLPKAFEEIGNNGLYIVITKSKA